MLGAQLLRRMPSTQPLREQALLYASAAAVISPHGAASVNAVFLRRGAVFIELHATCATHCASGCFPKHRSGPRGELSLLDALELPAERGCELVQPPISPPYLLYLLFISPAVSWCSRCTLGLGLA